LLMFEHGNRNRRWFRFIQVLKLNSVRSKFVEAA
jgi:hypothetical protein